MGDEDDGDRRYEAAREEEMDLSGAFARLRARQPCGCAGPFPNTCTLCCGTGVRGWHMGRMADRWRELRSRFQWAYDSGERARGDAGGVKQG